MLAGRAGVIAAARRRLLDRGAVVLVGEPGSGRTAVLDAIAETADRVHRGTGLVLARDVPLLPLSMALRDAAPTEPEAAVAWVREHVGGGVLVLDDVDLADEATIGALPHLVGTIALACAVTNDVHGASLRARLVAAGAEAFDLDPLSDDVAARLLEELPADGRAAALARAGGSPRLLVDLRDGRLSARGRRIVEHAAAGLDEEQRSIVGRLALAGGRLPLAALGTIRDGVPGCTVDGDDVVLRRGLLGEEVLATTARDALDAWRTEVAEALRHTGRLAEAAHQWELAGDAEEARGTALAAAQLPNADRATCLAIAARCSDVSDPVLIEAAAALLDRGDVDSALPILERSTDDGTDRLVLLARCRRLSGDAAGAAAALTRAGLDAPGARREAALLELWPGGRLDALSGAELEGDAPDLGFVRRVLALVVLVADGRSAEVVEASNELPSWSAAQTPRWRRSASVTRSLVAFHTDVRAGVEAVDDVAVLSSEGSAILAAHAALALADLGRTTEALAILDRIGDVEGDGAAAALGWITAEVNLIAGRLAAARAAAQRAVTRAADGPLAGLSALADTWAATEHGEVIARPDVPARGRRIDRAIALERAAVVLRDDASARRDAFREAEAMWEGISVRNHLRCQWAAADATGDVEALRRLEHAAARRGMLPLVGRARTSLRREGVRTQAARGAGDGLLSAREREVLTLVGQGVPSREIAQRLGVARATIETQVASAMAKLGVRTRLQAVARMTEPVRP